MGTRTRTRPNESRYPGRITLEGFRKLQEESTHLWNVERPRVRDGVSEAAAEGDRSENAEYIYGKIRLGQIDRRLRHLGNRLEVLTVVTERPPDDGKVHFGSWVVVEAPDGKERCYRIVGADESDGDKGWISEKAPVGKALLGGELDDEVVVKIPKGDVEYVITEIHLDRPPERFR